MNRRQWLSSCAILFTLACSSDRKVETAAPHTTWTTGFWAWGSADPAKYAQAIDVLYAETLEANPPAAHDYWLVQREARPPKLDLVPELLTRFHARAQLAKPHISGLQLDIDWPTSRLRDYAEFLKAVRQKLPAETELSITALLDWFEGDTAIADVLAQVDEFVPQFYDLHIGRDSSIAAPIDAAKWAPRFNKFKKRYRIGIATFGRARWRDSRSSGYPSVGYFSRDTLPLQFALMPGFTLESETNAAHEQIVRYRAERSIKMQYQTISPGSSMEFVLPTEASVRTAYVQAKQFGGYAAGVLFFRWPVADEKLVLPPDEVLRYAGLSKLPNAGTAVEAGYGDCAAVTCADLSLVRAPLSSKPVTYTIHIDGDMEYFLPREGVPIKPRGPRELIITLPPYTAQPRLELGRLVTKNPVKPILQVTP